MIPSLTTSDLVLKFPDCDHGADGRCRGLCGEPSAGMALCTDAPIPLSGEAGAVFARRSCPDGKQRTRRPRPRGGSSVKIASPFARRFVLFAVMMVLVLALVPAALAGKGGGGGSHTGGGTTTGGTGSLTMV